MAKEKNKRPKFEPGQMVWYIKEGCVWNSKVRAALMDGYGGYEYMIAKLEKAENGGKLIEKEWTLDEWQLFKSKDELIKSIKEQEDDEDED